MILISNDDSIFSQGLKELVKIASEFDNEIVVVAPISQQSAKSHSISLGRPLKYEEVDVFGDKIKAYAVDGTPVDCVKMALNIILDKKPDLILSGINHGGNYSVNLIYSGTVAVIIEAAMHKINAVAFSVDNHDTNLELSAVTFYARKILKSLISNKIDQFCLNINFPYLPLEQIKGIRICKQTEGAWFEDFEEIQLDYNSHKQYILKGRHHNYEPENTNTDIWAIENGYVAIVPIKPDLTDYNKINELSTIKF